MTDLSTITSSAETHDRSTTWGDLAASAWSEVKANPGKSAALAALALGAGGLELYCRLRGKGAAATAIEHAAEELAPRIEKAGQTAAPRAVAEWTEGPWGTKSIEAANKAAARPSFDWQRQGVDGFLADGRHVDASAPISLKKKLDFSSDIAARSNRMREEDLTHMYLQAQQPFDFFKSMVRVNSQEGRFVELDPLTQVAKLGKRDLILRSDTQMSYVRLRNGEQIALQGVDHTTGESRIYSGIPRGSGLRGDVLLTKISPHGKVTSAVLDDFAEQFRYEHDFFIASANRTPVYPVLGKMK